MSEGMVSILEPFLDTIIICTLTGLVILSSGVWTEKIENDFQPFDMQYVAGSYDETDSEDRAALFHHLNFGERVGLFTGEVEVVDGRAVSGGYTLLHNRSIAENVTYSVDERAYSGSLKVSEGQLADQVQVRGRSLIHSVDLTSEAFTRGVFGESGKFIVSLGLVLFAFTTAVAWSYYGDRAMTYLFGAGSVTPYRLLYVIGFFLAAVADTSLIWLVSAITIALMTIPNLFSILLLRQEVRATIDDYWDRFRLEHPERN